MRQSLNRIYVLHLPPCIASQRLMQRALECVSAEKRARLQKLRCRGEYERILLGDFLLRRVLSDVTGTAPEQLAFTFGEHQKPQLASRADVQFNLSHSGEYAVCAVSEQPVGIDTEQPAEIAHSLAREFFHPDEAAFLDGLPETLYQEYFFRLWTLKEAYVKYLGTGLTTALDSFSFVGKDQIFYTHPFAPALYFAQFRLPEGAGYFVSVCGGVRLCEVCTLTPADVL